MSRSCMIAGIDQCSFLEDYVQRGTAVFVMSTFFKFFSKQ